MFSCAGQCESLAVPKSLVRLYLHAHIPVPDPGYTSEHYTSPNFFFFLFSQLIFKKVIVHPFPTIVLDKKIAIIWPHRRHASERDSPDADNSQIHEYFRDIHPANTHHGIIAVEYD